MDADEQDRLDDLVMDLARNIGALRNHRRMLREQHEAVAALEGECASLHKKLAALTAKHVATEGGAS